jgi:hypothetical protein
MCVYVRAGSISIIFVDVDYRFFSIIFDDFDFGFDVDFFVIAISISIIFSQSCIQARIQELLVGGMTWTRKK